MRTQAIGRCRVQCVISFEHIEAPHWSQRYRKLKVLSNENRTSNGSAGWKTFVNDAGAVGVMRET